MPHVKHLILILFAASAAITSFAQHDVRFMIVENDKVGYINSTGKVIIQPVYLSGADFSEGLAAVRVGGKYGFIDPYGKFVIPAQYDFASSFQFGLAAVYTDGKVKLLDKTGKCVLENRHYKDIRVISAGKAIVVTKKKRYELMDIPSGKSLVTIPTPGIRGFRDGLAVVLRKDKSKKDYADPHYAVIDTMGRFLVDFGIYSEIHDFVDGIALVKGYTGKSEENPFVGAINTRGELLFSRPKTSQSFMFDDFHDGLAVIHFSNYWNAEKKEFSVAKKDYAGYINLQGEIVRNDTLNRYLNDFSEGRVFIQNAAGKLELYDTHFNRVTEEVFDHFEAPGFRNGFARVRKKTGWGIIDTNGVYYCKPKFLEITGIDYEKRVFIYESENESDSELPLYGIANFRGEPICDSNLQKVDWNLFKNGLMKVLLNDSLSYINHLGDVIWQEKPVADKVLIPLNTEYMTSGYFTAFSEQDEEDLGGFGRSLNSAKPIADNKLFKPRELSVLVDNHPLDTFARKYKGFTVYVANNLVDTVKFNAQDSRLYMNVQAKDARGNWRDIEHLPGSWCGNSYHTLKLEPNHYWEFVTPVYDGAFKTKLRIKLEVRSSGKSKDHTRTIYSNEYDGSVNPGQFWNTDHHIPSGIMDPYSY